jgi:integrase
MQDMPRPRPPHLHRQVTRHGKAVWYVRIRKGPRIRIRSPFGTPEFDAEYQAALSGAPRRQKGAPAAGTLGWLIARYREVGAWTTLALATRRKREAIFKHAIEAAGDAPYSKITAKAIRDGCERRSKTPAQAGHFFDTMSGLLKWAAKAELIAKDPTAGLDNPYIRKGDGIPPWTEDDVAAYERRWPIGTRERVWLDVLLYTGLRRGDAVQLGRQHIRDRVIEIKTEKTGTPVWLRLLPVLQATLAAGPCGDLTFIVGDTGRPLTAESFGNAFRKACRAAGVRKSPHGLRKIAATRAANAGATVAELESMFGWTGGNMASHYTRSADRRRLGLSASHKLLENEDRKSIPSPRAKVRGAEQKAK